jgi:hypothetical protein
VIGNGAYRGITRLKNPVNDANDMAAALQDLGFQVDKVLNGGCSQMEEAAGRLGADRNAYGFLFYAEPSVLPHPRLPGIIARAFYEGKETAYHQKNTHRTHFSARRLGQVAGRIHQDSQDEIRGLLQL